MTPVVVISLDFELRWGLLDVLGDDRERYAKNLLGVEDVVPRLLDVFARRNVHATWATVGSVACGGWDEWHARAPTPPRYADAKLRWRDTFERIDPSGRLHFAPGLVAAIASAPDQELASHTFSHIYLREPGVTRADADADAAAVAKLFKDRAGQVPVSLVFPRNQVGFIDVARTHGIRFGRENPAPRYWQATAEAEQRRSIRLLRFSDSLLPMGRRRAPRAQQRASYFVRVGLPDALWNLHRARIRRDARRLRDSEALHLWVHPHNFGDDPRRKTARLAELLDAVRDAAPPATRFVSMREL